MAGRKLRKCSAMELAFVEAYVGKCFLNATAAARKAGYSNPNAHGSEILERPQVQAEIKRRCKSVGAGEPQVLRFLSDVLAGPSAYVYAQGSEPAYDIEQLIADGKGHIIHKVKEKSGGMDEPNIVEVEFESRMAAAALLARVLGMDKGVEPQGVNVTVQVLNGVSLDDL